jgi:predicted transcriptional regulator
MNIEARKINLINWISSITEENILKEVEKIQREKADWWDTISEEDKIAINEGLEQLDNGEFLTQSEVRAKIKKKFNF